MAHVSAHYRESSLRCTHSYRREETLSSSIFTGGPQLPACKNDDFYWSLVLAVTKNATINRFTTATIELLCTSARRYRTTTWHNRPVRMARHGTSVGRLPHAVVKATDQPQEPVLTARWDHVGRYRLSHCCHDR
jgi:hypothetical protein